jgi:hypothetical protein
LRLGLLILKLLSHISQKTHPGSTTKTKKLKLFTGIIDDYCEKHEKGIITLRWENVGFQILQQAAYTNQITQSFTELTVPGQVHGRICNKSLSLRQQKRPSLSEINT